MISFAIFFTVCLCFSLKITSLEGLKVDCVNTSLAILSTDESKYTVTLPSGCKSKNENGKYFLDSSCLGEKKVIVVSLNVASPYHLTGGKETKVFTVTCIEQLDINGANMKTTTNVNVIGSPVHKHILINDPDVKMFLTKMSPVVTDSLPTPLQDDQQVSLGEKLFLVIESPVLPDSGNIEYYLPEKCEASSSPPLNLTITIWDSATSDRNCIKEPTLMENFTIYQNGKRYGNNTYNMVFAPVYTFIFEQVYVHRNQISYTCSFLLCPESSFSTDSKGRCTEKLANSTQCLNLETTGRRRRGVQSSSSDVFTTRTLSATVLIDSGGFDQGNTGIHTFGTWIVVLIGVLVPVIVTMAIVMVLLVVSESKRRKQQSVTNIHGNIEMTRTNIS